LFDKKIRPASQTARETDNSSENTWDATSVIVTPEKIENFQVFPVSLE
jgi:hypothetical protein